MDSGQTGEKVLTRCTGWGVKPRPWQAPCEHWGDESRLLDGGGWGSISDLLGDLSALSSYEDALAEAVYEELEYLVTQKESLLGSPGGCLLCPPGSFGCHHPLAVCLLSIFIPNACPTLTEAAPIKW